MRVRIAVALCAALCSTVAPSVALAQGGAEREAEDAERLFREAQRLMAERRFGDACPKLETVYAKDHELGTLLNLAYCHKMQGASWQAWLEFKEAEVKAIELKRNDRRDFARKRMAELERSLVRVAVDPPQTVELTDVLVEDRRVPDAEKGVTFAAEAGPRKITFRARGKKPAVKLVTFARAERGPQYVTVPPMEEEEKPKPPEPVAAPTPSAAAPEPRSGAAPSPSAPGEKPQASSQRTVALVLAGVGAAGIGVGAVTGIMTLSNDCAGARSSCPTDPAARSEEKDAGRTTGRIADVAFGVGGAALVAAVVLWVTAPSKTTSGTRASVVPSLGAGWAGLGGQF